MVTKLFPLSEKAIVVPLFGGATDKDALCVRAVPDYYQGQGRSDKKANVVGSKAQRLLPLRLEATLSVLDLSGVEPKAAHFLGGSQYVIDPSCIPGLLSPRGGLDAFKPSTAAGGMMGDFGYFYQLQLLVEDAANASRHTRAECQAVAVEAPGRAAHVHFGVNVMLLQFDKAENEDVEMDAVESWNWMDGTWSKLAWK